MDSDFGEIGTASPRTRISVHFLPAFACVIAAINSAKLRVGINRGEDDLRIAERYPEAYSPQSLLECRKTFCQLFPGGAAIGGFKQPTAGPLPGAVLPRPLPPGPEISVNCVRI